MSLAASLFFTNPSGRIPSLVRQWKTCWGIHFGLRLQCRELPVRARSFSDRFP